MSQPVLELGKEFLKFKNCNCSHTNDVLTLDINSENQLVTGSLDNTISLWDSFSAQESKSIKLPDIVAPLATGRQIQYVRYPFQKNKQLRNFLLVIMNRGQCYIIETQSERWIKYFKEEQLKKELDDSDECSCRDEYHSDGDGCSDDLNVSGIDSTIRQSIIKEEESAANAKRKSNYGSNNSPDHIRTQTNPSRGSHYSSMQNKSNIEKMQAKKKKHADPYIIARCSPHPTIAIENEYLVSITDNGKGRLHKISFDQSKTKTAELGPGI